MAKPKNCISVSEAKELQGNWKKTRVAEIEIATGISDPRDFTFSLSEMEEYVAYVKELSNRQGVSDPGIRIYFAAYDTADNKKATVFLAPTIGTSTDADNNYEIDPLNRTQGGWPPNNY
ncbi:MAG TPA: hypothetical protein DCS66_07400 [Flavobacteriaceae bacterium]|nr:hypothetical protein [Flavobacteriaceae bacterium]|tara:strand:+ start:89364 stop:89720 length:357 start_codon:yes stop_codon:yes gene_type:complete